mmetsp:Transcript_41602/g.62869  ORF Transcript_41602/g.62869 Transcript_41602/m.62869 type:complete len:103 (-) Transcript_41602:2-310(-)
MFRPEVPAKMRRRSMCSSPPLISESHVPSGTGDLAHTSGPSLLLRRTTETAPTSPENVAKTRPRSKGMLGGDDGGKVRSVRRPWGVTLLLLFAFAAEGLERF